MLKLGIEPEKLYWATFLCQYGLRCFNITLVSFRLFRKNLATCEIFGGQMVPPPLGKKLPVRLWLHKSESWSAHVLYTVLLFHTVFKSWKVCSGLKAPWVIFSFSSEGNSKFCDDVTNNFIFLELKISFATNSVSLIRFTCSPWFSIQSSTWIRNSKLSSNIIVYLLKSLFTPSAFSFQILDYLRSNDKYIQEPFQRNHRLNIYTYNLRTQP